MKRWDVLAGCSALVAAPGAVGAQTTTKLRVALTADEDAIGLLYTAGVGDAYADAHQDQVLPLLATFTGIDPSQLVNMTRIVVGTLPQLRDPKMFQPMIDPSALAS